MGSEVIGENPEHSKVELRARVIVVDKSDLDEIVPNGSKRAPIHVVRPPPRIVVLPSSMYRRCASPPGCGMQRQRRHSNDWPGFRDEVPDDSHWLARLPRIIRGAIDRNGVDHSGMSVDD